MKVVVTHQKQGGSVITTEGAGSNATYKADAQGDGVVLGIALSEYFEKRGGSVALIVIDEYGREKQIT